MDPKERFRNKFVGVIPRLAEEWDIRKPQKETHVGASEGKYKQHNNERIEDMYRYVDKIPYDQGKYENQRNDRLSRNEEENRPIKYGDVLDGTQFRPKSVQGVNIEQSQQYSSSSSDESASSETQERDVSEYKQESLRSRYVEDGRRNAGAGYGERFAARRDKELLADRMASSTTPCRCRSEHSPVL
ncbi:uncharacterized protein LOC133531008 [Cydia pomonella]|nr:uncharacterized protein LOC133531008 [Cydia pomonella]